MKKVLFFFTIGFIVFGCTSKKIVTEYKDRVVKDTIFTTRTIKEVERYTDTLTVEEPCDSLGNLKPFKQVLKIKQGSILIEGKNDSITAKIYLNGYKSILDKTYKVKYEKLLKESSKEVVKFKTPLWMWITIIFQAIVIVLLVRIKFF